MNREIQSDGDATVIVLDTDMGIQNAADFHRAVLPLAVIGRPVRVNAVGVKSAHTSIMQILYALSQAVPDFGVIEPSEEFKMAEARLGHSFARDPSKGATARPEAA